jgi:hypothetical protein
MGSVLEGEWADRGYPEGIEGMTGIVVEKVADWKCPKWMAKTVMKEVSDWEWPEGIEGMAETVMTEVADRECSEWIMEVIFMGGAGQVYPEGKMMFVFVGYGHGRGYLEWIE